MKQNFPNNILVTDKTPFFVIGLFCAPYPIYLNKTF